MVVIGTKICETMDYDHRVNEHIFASYRSDRRLSLCEYRMGIGKNSYVIVWIRFYKVLSIINHNPSIANMKHSFSYQINISRQFRF